PNTLGPQRIVTTALVSLSPKALLTRSRTTYCPGPGNSWTGLRSFDVLPSSKFQLQLVGLPDEVSVKATTLPEIEKLNAAMGGDWIEILTLSEMMPLSPPLSTVTVICRSGSDWVSAAETVSTS